MAPQDRVIKVPVKDIHRWDPVKRTTNKQCYEDDLYYALTGIDVSSKASTHSVRAACAPPPLTRSCPWELGSLKHTQVALTC